MVKRLKCAYKSSIELKKIAELALNEFQVIEMDAYCCYMQAVFQIETQKYQEALENLLKSKIIHQKLATYKGNKH